ncbi:flagellar protein FlaG [Campylobacter sputorum aubsp. sputorum RM3237]|uniref:Flagellar protein FlaG n=1 Tax=Campylobacter sputorum subsp. sputorum TaxID=32024 RepID=A0A381DHL9_9BACT|nr:flagellar protein FlaG [Campylobacter sputorum]ASM35243.1 flagellar protein FlaG [Campylobacter sputorum aubsp. sputorum RM3237]KAB0580861.1 flagellar biosynthesis protein FlaG [Campylobacter sputorum subsp. sputorum]QEL05434.1 flagellar protein FlaG [Campylobacter sputorum subsp. sputorum]SUX10156.1 flagellar protein FlaG [Campylobacter sputorum subsp. sputorum]
MEIYDVASRQMDSSISLSQTQNSTKSVLFEKSDLSSSFNEELNQKRSLSNEEINKIADRLNKQMESLQTNIRFAYNEEISSLYVNVLEKNTGEVIRKIPTESMMKLSEHFKEIIGLLMDKKG